MGKPILQITDRRIQAWPIVYDLRTGLADLVVRIIYQPTLDVSTWIDHFNIDPLVSAGGNYFLTNCFDNADSFPKISRIRNDVKPDQVFSRIIECVIKYPYFYSTSINRNSPIEKNSSDIPPSDILVQPDRVFLAFRLFHSPVGSRDRAASG